MRNLDDLTLTENDLDTANRRKVNPPEKLLTPDDLAEWLGVSAGWVRNHATRSEPKLPVVRLGKLMRFKASEIEEFLKEQGVR